MPGQLILSRAQILARRRRVQSLDERLPFSPEHVRSAAWAGLQDSVPRSALHALHARVQGVEPDAWEDPALVQVWGPRYAAFVVPSDAHIPFTLGRLPDGGRLPARAGDLAARLNAHLDGRRLTVEEAARGLTLRNVNQLRYASLTGTVLIRWGGARQPTIWTVPHDVDPLRARMELVRRYLHVVGPSTMQAFIRWGGIDGRSAAAAFEALAPELVTVRTPLGSAQLLGSDEQMAREPAAPTRAVRLLPSGDPYYLLWNADRELLVTDAGQRAQLWTTRVWPGALLVDGEIAGTWRRSKATVVVTCWRRLSAATHEAVEAEVASLPLPNTGAPATARWDEAHR
jgi:hypothetical protein